MSKKRVTSSLPPEVIEHWPEVFGELDIKVVPLEYLHSVRVHFDDGKVWDIDIARSKAKDPATDIEQALSELFDNYEDAIKNIDFRLDTERLKTDIKRRTNLFLKKRR